MTAAPSTHGPPVAARSPRAAAGRATHVARQFARALRRAVTPAAGDAAGDAAARGARIVMPVFHPPGVIRVITPAEAEAISR